MGLFHDQFQIKHGFKFVSQKGSHRKYKGIIKGRKRRVTVLADRKSFHPKTLKSMIRQSGLTEEEFEGLMELAKKYEEVETYDTEDVTEDILEAFKDLKKRKDTFCERDTK